MMMYEMGSAACDVKVEMDWICLHRIDTKKVAWLLPAMCCLEYYEA